MYKIWVRHPAEHRVQLWFFPCHKEELKTEKEKTGGDMNFFQLRKSKKYNCCLRTMVL